MRLEKNHYLMKRKFYLLSCISMLATVIFTGCKKEDKAVARPKEQLIQAKWEINKVQLKFYTSSGVLVKDSTVKQTPQPQNYATFSGSSAVEYRFNKPTSDIGTYGFVGADSIYASIGTSIPDITTSGNWYNQLLTETNFNLIGRGTSPGYPGYYVIIYQNFVR